jgi:hypothetical protein
MIAQTADAMEYPPVPYLDQKLPSVVLESASLSGYRGTYRYVRFGPLADMCTAKGHVRFTHKSRHV